MTDLKNFYRGKKVFLTGHTGFKGMWLTKMLTMAGAKITGFALDPVTDEQESVLKRADILTAIHSVTGDIRNFAALKKAFDEAQPEIVFHLAAQPIVLEGYRDPIGTYGTNVMGTVNLLECLRQSEFARSAVIITTDKVYLNREWAWGYRENEALDGFDPYSNSKSCAELAVSTYRRSFFAESDLALSTARAGNVIGGGDFAPRRIIPDCVRAAYAKKEIVVRNPASVRPYQHVLDPLAAYLLIAKAAYENKNYADAYNVGPDEDGCVTTGKLVELFVEAWGNGLTWRVEQQENAPHEAHFLKLDCAKLKDVFGWRPRWNVETAVKRTVEWAKAYQSGEDISAVMDSEIKAFMNK